MRAWGLIWGCAAAGCAMVARYTAAPGPTRYIHSYNGVQPSERPSTQHRGHISFQAFLAQGGCRGFRGGAQAGDVAIAIIHGYISIERMGRVSARVEVESRERRE